MSSEVWQPLEIPPHRAFLWRNVVVFEPHDTSETAIAPALQVIESALEGTRGPIAFILAPKPGLAPPSGQGRASVQALFSRLAERMSVLSICIRGRGMVGSIQRSVATGVFMMVRTGFPVKIAGDLREASDHVASRHQVDAAALVAGIRERLEEDV